MIRIVRLLAPLFVVLGLIMADGSALAQPKDKDKAQDRKEQGGAKPKEKKQHKHMSGKDMVGDKIKKDGTHKLHENGKHTASVNVSKGKITGVKVRHAEKGDVRVTKYKTTKKMVDSPMPGIRLVSSDVAQSQYLGLVWIGYSYIDDWGDEVIYWFPYDMIYDGDTGAVEYYPV
ncbi:MAG TPA: hypothetical protein VFF62_07280 [Candidatus Nitrosocosmicus sp.]|jgi:hypothetical protein|nr:hypothetical protein [Candidatus Nitrosocosmicus sp.]